MTSSHSAIERRREGPGERPQPGDRERPQPGHRERPEPGDRERPQPGHRERLLAGAVRCLRDRGYARTTARDLVRESRTNLGSIPYHFGSKEALLNEAIARTMDAWCDEVEREVFADADATPEERLRRTFAMTVDRFAKLRPFLVAFVEAFPPAARSDALREVMADGYARCRASGAEMIARMAGPAIAPEQAAVLASLILAVCDGLILQWLLDPAAVPTSDEIMEALGSATRLLS